VRLDVAMNEAQPQGEVERSRALHDLEDVTQLEQAVAALYFCSVPPSTYFMTMYTRSSPATAS